MNAARKAALSAGQTVVMKGDIVPPDHLPRLVLECKSYKEFRFHQLMQPGRMPQLDQWAEQCRAVVDPADV